MILTPELIIKHRDALLESTVKSYTKHSKSGKTFTVAQHERHAARIAKMIQDVQDKYYVQVQMSVHHGGDVGRNAHKRAVMLGKALNKLKAAHKKAEKAEKASRQDLASLFSPRQMNTVKTQTAANRDPMRYKDTKTGTIVTGQQMDKMPSHMTTNFVRHKDTRKRKK